MTVHVDPDADCLQNQCTSSEKGSAADWAWSEAAGRLIVRFQSYKTAAAHKSELAASVVGQGSAWKWVDRVNAAAAYPTDFALLDVLDSEADQVKVGI